MKKSVHPESLFASLYSFRITGIDKLSRLLLSKTVLIDSAVLSGTVDASSLIMTSYRLNRRGIFQHIIRVISTIRGLLKQSSPFFGSSLNGHAKRDDRSSCRKTKCEKTLLFAEWNIRKSELLFPSIKDTNTQISTKSILRIDEIFDCVRSNPDDLNAAQNNRLLTI
jgi:hypothetical protein